MKPETFAKLIGDYADQIIDGFKSSADNEKYAQVVIDRAIKTRWSASLEHQNFGGTKIREIHYPNQENLGQSADFMMTYVREREQKPDKPFKISNFWNIPKHTSYVIELKTESGDNIGRFSGMSWKKAFKSDIDKIAGIASWMAWQNFVTEIKTDIPTGERRFAVLLSFYPTTTGKIAADHATTFPKSIFGQIDKGHYAFGILVQQV